MNLKTLKNDLLKEYCYRTELHAHTSPASSCSEISPEDVVTIYKNLGYDAVTIANHFTFNYQNSDKQTVLDRFFGDFERAKKKGDEIGIKVILAAEIRFTVKSMSISYIPTIGLPVTRIRRIPTNTHHPVDRNPSARSGKSVITVITSRKSA